MKTLEEILNKIKLNKIKEKQEEEWEKQYRYKKGIFDIYYNLKTDLFDYEYSYFTINSQNYWEAANIIFDLFKNIKEHEYNEHILIIQPTEKELKKFYMILEKYKKEEEDKKEDENEWIEINLLENN